MFTDLKKLSGKHGNKFVKIRLLKISPRLKCVATLPCDVSSITALVWKCRLFSDNDVLQGSVATRIRRDGTFSNRFIANFLENLPVKKFWQSVKVWWSYSQEFGVSRFNETRVHRIRLHKVAALLPSAQSKRQRRRRCRNCEPCWSWLLCKPPARHPFIHKRQSRGKGAQPPVLVWFE